MTLAPERPGPAPTSEAEEPRLGELLGGAEAGARAGAAAEPQGPVDDGPGPPSPGLVCLAAALAAAAAGYVVGSLFTGLLPRLVALLAAGLGAGMVWLSHRTRRTTWVQLLVLPAAGGLGALLVAPDASGGAATLPRLVAEAVRQGGLGRPPVAFDPGWRFLLVLTVTTLAGAAAALATAFDRPRVAVFVPLPVALAALGATASTAGLLTSFVALGLVVAGFGVAYGAQLAQEGTTSGGFELRRLVRGGATMVILVVLLGGLSQVGFLFPAASHESVVPPRPPGTPPAERDRELFVVQGAGQLPWRLGALDGYDGRQWLTPPYDPARLVRVPSDGELPTTGATDGSGGGVRAAVTVSDIGGHLLPVPANPTAVPHSGFALRFDPRTQTLSLPDERARRGLTYSVVLAPQPRARDLSSAGPPPPAMRPFLAAPPVPDEVAAVIAQAPKADLFTRLQYVRQRFYAKVVAAGAGTPKPVPPSRVLALLHGAPGSPYEITAAEALLARWVGVPSRLGFGYFGGQALSGGRTSFRPRDGATWLEAYFAGQGWVPIVGTPPRAQSSLSSAPKNNRPSVRPSEDLTLPSYVPVRVPTVRLLYVLVQFWVLRTVPYLMLGALVLWLYPALAKGLRRVRRRRWARRGGPSDRIRVAYAGWRDACHDLGVGHPALTPLELLSRTEPDREHSELAWLVTRCLWGDLVRDVRAEDVVAAEQMAASLTRRLRSVQPVTARLVALASRRSLRDPYSDELPNVWWAADPLHRRVARRAWRAVARVGTRGWAGLRGLLWHPRARPLPTTALLLVLVVLLGGCARDVQLAHAPSEPLPVRLVPPRLGDLTFQRELRGEAVFAAAGPQSLVGEARVFSVRRGGDVVAALQAAAFKTTVEPRAQEVRAGLVQELGNGQFRLTRIGADLVYTTKEPDRQLFLYLPPDRPYYELFIARGDFAAAPSTLSDLLDFQNGRTSHAPVEPSADPRRGFQD